MAELHFLRPFWFIAFVPLIILLVYLYKKEKQSSAWKSEVDAHLLDHILISTASFPLKKSRVHPRMIIVFFWSVSIIALAGPSWNKMPPIQMVPVISPLVVVLNLSHSMQTQDIYPNRLKQAHYKLRTLLERMPNRPIALVVYSAQAHSVMPLTQDTRLVTHFLEYMTPDIVPAQGSNSRAGLQLATDILQRNKSKNGQILVVTDSIDEQALNSIKQLSSLDLDVLVYAVVPDKGVYNSNTDPGDYQIVTNDDADIKNLLSQMSNSYFSPLEISDTKAQKQSIQKWQDRGAWLIALVLPLLLLMFRPGLISALLPGVIFCCFCLTSLPAEANSWQKLWYNSNELGSRALDYNNPEQAEQLFSNPFWQGVAQYRQKKFTQALESFSRVNTAESFYNKGNTLVHLERYNEAMLAYNTALKIKSSLTEAKINLQLVEKYKQQIESNEQSEKNLINLFNKKNNNKISTIDVDKKSIDKTEDIQKSLDKKQKDVKDQNNKTSSGNTSMKSDTLKKKDETGQGSANNTQPGNKDNLTQKKKGNNEPKTGLKSLTNKLSTEPLTNSSTKTTTIPSNKTIHSNSEHENEHNKSKTSVNQTIDETKSSAKTTSKKVKNSAKKNNSSHIQETKAEETKVEDTEKKAMNNNRQHVSSTKTTTEYGKAQQLINSKNEQFQSLEHWLDSIDDDPSELLKEKFKREYKKSLNASKVRQP